MPMWSLDYGICGVLKDSKYIIINHKLRCLESLCDLEHPGQIWYIWPSESFLPKGYTKNDMFSVNMYNIFLSIHYLSTEFKIEDMNWKRFSTVNSLEYLDTKLSISNIYWRNSIWENRCYLILLDQEMCYCILQEHPAGYCFAMIC